MLFWGEGEPFYGQEGVSMPDALEKEWFNRKKALIGEGLSSANSFKRGFGRLGILIGLVKKIN